MTSKKILHKAHVLSPFLFALAPALLLWVHNLGETATREVIPALVVVLLFATLVFAIFQLFYRNSHKASILASVFLLLTLSYQYIFFSPLTSDFMRHRYAFVIVFIIISLLGYMLWRTRKDVTAHANILTAVSGTFVLISLIGLGAGLWGQYTYKTSPEQTELATSLTEVRTENETLRDIYYIILDAHLSPSILKKAMDDDEINDITDFLSERGFFIANSSKSNYTNTLDSLSSSLNMRYLTDEERELVDARVDIMFDSLVGNFLKRQGYHYINLGAGWVDYYNPHADENIYFNSLTTYQALLVYTSILGFPESGRSGFAGLISKTLRLSKFNQRFVQWQRVQFKFKELAKIPELEEPVFVLAHFDIPHPPYVFDAEGNYVTEKESETQTQGERYVGSVEFMSSQVQELVDNILANSKPEPIIIIQSDHGWNDFTPETLAKSTLSEKELTELPVSILNTYYFPDGGDEALYDSISPVNSFRVLLNHYFNQELLMLPDESFFSI